MDMLETAHRHTLRVAYLYRYNLDLDLIKQKNKDKNDRRFLSFPIH